MTDYDNNGYNFHSTIVEFDEQEYLVNGKIDDPITMFRPIEELLECERDNLQIDLGDNYES